MPGHVDACGFLVSPLALVEAEHKIFVLYSLYTCVYLNFLYCRASPQFCHSVCSTEVSII